MAYWTVYHNLQMYRAVGSIDRQLVDIASPRDDLHDVVAVLQVLWIRFPLPLRRAQASARQVQDRTRALLRPLCRVLMFGIVNDSALYHTVLSWTNLRST